MSNKIDLPNNEWAEIRESREVPERLRRAHMAAYGEIMKAVGINIGDGDGTTPSITVNKIDPVMALTEMGPSNDTLILAFTKSWSLRDEEGGPLGINTISLGDLAAETFDALLEAAQVADKAGKPFVADPSQAADPGSPIEPLAE